MTSQIYQQLQQIYGTPGSSTSFDAIYNNFTSALQSLSTSPSSYSDQAAVIGSAQAVAQNLNSMTTSIQQLRTQAEQGIANDVQTANSALRQIAQINQQLEGSTASDSSAATLEDQRDQDITQLAQLMNIRVVQNPANQISVFTGTGLQLVAGSQASQLNFDNAGTLSATSLWSADPSEDGAGTITLVSPAGSDHRSDRRQRDPVGRARRLYPDARQHPAAGAEPARRIGQPDVAGAVEPDDKRDGGYFRRAVWIQRRRRRPVAGELDCSSPTPIPTTFSTRSRSCRSVPAARCRCRLRRPMPTTRRSASIFPAA